MKNKMLILPLCLLFFIVLFFAFLPKILSTSWAKNKASALIEKRYQARLSIESMHFSWLGPQWINTVTVERKDIIGRAKRIEFDTSFFSLIRYRNRVEKLLFSGALEILDGSLSMDDKISLTHLNAKTGLDKTVSVTGQTKQGKETGDFSLSGKVTKGSTWNLKILRFPSPILENFSPYPFTEILGSTFDADVQIHFSQASMKEFTYEKSVTSKNLKAKSTGNYKNGVIELSTPLEASFMLTEALSNQLFKEASFQPISAKFIHLWLYPQGTHIPIRPFSWKNLTIPSLILDLQKIECRNFGTLSDFLSVIQLFPRPNQNVHIWFQSAPMSIKNGICTIERTEMLIDNRYEMGFWGSLNLIDQTANMHLGITASALRAALGLQTIPDDYTVPMRIDGPFKDLHVHKTSPLKVIGALVLIEKQPFFPIPGNVFRPEVKPSPPVRKPLPW